MQKTTDSVMVTVKNFTENASVEEKRLLAMFLIYNVSLDCTDDISSAIGLLEIVKMEMLNEYSKERTGTGFSSN